MPWCFLIGDHVAQMVVEDIDNLIIRDRIFVSMACTKISQGSVTKSAIIKPTKDICRVNIIVEITPEMLRFCARPRALFDVFELSAMHH